MSGSIEPHKLERYLSAGSLRSNAIREMQQEGKKVVFEKKISLRKKARNRLRENNEFDMYRMKQSLTRR